MRRRKAAARWVPPKMRTLRYAALAKRRERAEHQERDDRVGVGRVDELHEEGDEEEDRLGVEQADHQRATVGPLAAGPGLHAGLHGGVGDLVGDRDARAPHAPGCAQHADGEPQQVGRAHPLHDGERRRVGLQQRRDAGRGQGHQHRVAGPHPRRAGVPAPDPPPGGDGEDVERVRARQQDDQDEADEVGREVGDAQHASSVGPAATDLPISPDGWHPRPHRDEVGRCADERCQGVVGPAVHGVNVV